MRLIRVGLLAALLGACGSDPEPNSGAAAPQARVAPEGNREPVIRSMRIVPAAPTVGDPLALNLKAIDPDGDKLDTQIEWFRNGRSFQSGDAATLDTRGFVRGDQIYAVARVSDGVLAITERTPMVEITNQPPRVTRIQLAPENPNAGTDLTAVAEVIDNDGDSFELGYEWLVNDAPVGVSGATLPAKHFKRGDVVMVRVSATDSYGDAEPTPSVPLTIPNGAPKITSNPSEATVGAGRYRYVIKAEDPDADRPLRYTLAEGPEGMTVDLLSGVISWKVPASAGGSYPVEVAVADPQGSATHQRYDLELSWSSTPADTP